MYKPIRKLRNYLLEPEVQLRRAYYFVAFFGCMLGGIIFWVYVQLIFAVEFLSTEDAWVAVRVTDLVKSLSWYTIIAYLITGVVAAVVFGIYSSHRVVGPSVAIKRHLDRLINGNYNEKLSIRTGDELGSLVIKINELTDALRKKNSNK